MDIKKIYNSSGKIIGELVVNEDNIDINIYKKMRFTLNRSEVGESLFSRQYNKEVFLKLFDEYTFGIGIIAAIFDVHYHIANLWYKNTLTVTGKKAGKRNSSYGQKFSEKRKYNISQSRIGEKLYNNGQEERFFREGDKIPSDFNPGRLPFSEELKAKLGQKIKEMQNAGVMKSGREVALLGWKNGKFEGVNFKRGIGGWITSPKASQRFFFRSLLELYYILLIENDDNITTYQYEPFIIECDNGSSYTPDFLLNETKIVELKSYDFIYKQGGEVQRKFEYKSQQAQKYCQTHEYEYQVIFDKDINFESGRFKNQLKEMKDTIIKYQIEFAQPERIWSKK